MRNKAVVLSAIALSLLLSVRSYATTCPTIGFATDCSDVITLDALGVAHIAVTGGPYDGPSAFFVGDDQLVGVVNNNASQTIDNLTLSGINIFHFDGDGAGSLNCDNFDGLLAPFGCPYSFGPTGYEGPTSSFSSLSLGDGVSTSDTGTVSFAGGIAPNQTSWFSLEAAPSLESITITGVNSTPEPGTLLLLGTGIGALYGRARRRRKA